MWDFIVKSNFLTSPTFLIILFCDSSIPMGTSSSIHASARSAIRQTVIITASQTLVILPRELKSIAMGTRSLIHVRLLRSIAMEMVSKIPAISKQVHPIVIRMGFLIHASWRPMIVTETVFMISVISTPVPWSIVTSITSRIPAK